MTAQVASLGAVLEELKQRRGDERVTFSDGADHLHDFVATCPQDAEVVARLAAFLASVEGVLHGHESPGNGSTPEGAFGGS